MRLVLDTNTALSGLLWGGPPGQLIDAAIAGDIQLAITAWLLAELQGVLQRTKFAGQIARRGLIVADVLDGYAALALMVKPIEIPSTIIHDPPDDNVLAAAVGAEAAMIVSGYADLLGLESFRGIMIATASDALERIKSLTVL